MAIAKERTEKQKLYDSKKLLLDLGYTIQKPYFYKCASCGKEKSMKEHNYYLTKNKMYESCLAKSIDKEGNEVEKNILPICKTCLENMFNELSINAKGNEKLAMYKITQELRIPWNEAAWEMADSARGASWKTYLGKFNSLPQYSSLTMEESDSYDGEDTATFKEEKILVTTSMKKKDKKEALLRWGDSWTDIELVRLEEFYHSMKAVNKIETPQDEDYLRKISRLSVKIDEAIDSGEGSKAKQLGDLYSKYMQDSKFRATDMTDADKQGGIRTFSQIYSEVESDDFIPPWIKYAKFLNVKQDLVDRTIMHIENFYLRFSGAERMSTPPEDTPLVKDGDLDG